MRHQTLLGSLPILAKFLGRKLGVHVIVGADQAQTDGNTIYLPALPADDPQVRWLANGFLDHEGGHLRYTDFEVQRPSTPIGEAITNILEDVRIERALGQALPGCRNNLARLMAHLVQQGDFWTLPGADATPAQLLQGYLVFRLRASVLHQTALGPLADQVESLIRQVLPLGAMVKLAALAFEVTQTTSTQEVVSLAQRLLQMLEEEQQAASQPPEQAGACPASAPGQGQDPCSGQPQTGTAPGPASDQGQDNGSGTAPAPTGHAPAGQDHPPGSASGQHQPPSPAQNPPGPATGPHGGVGSSGAGEVLRQILEAQAAELDLRLGDLGRRLGQRLTEAAGRGQRAVVMAEPDPVPRARDSAQVAAQARTASAALRRRLAGLIQASRREDSHRSRRGRRLRTRDLYRLRFNDPGLFDQRLHRQTPDTAVQILLDRSGSMGHGMVIATQAALATALALEALPGCAVAVGAFPGSQADRVIPLLGFAERATHAAGRFRIQARGGTPLAQALWWAGYQLALRPEARRLLLVVTDGEPDDWAASLDLIGRCRTSGIAVLGLGMGAGELVEGLFGRPSAQSIQDLRELAPTLFRILERRLTPPQS